MKPTYDLRVICAVVFTALGSITFSRASQVQGHLYAASEIKAQNTDMQTVMVADSYYYLAGAVGPDSSWISHLFTNEDARKSCLKGYELPPSLSTLSGKLDDIHYTKSVEICIGLLKNSRTKVEASYALGWITHFITDTYIHDIINRWGGYFYGVVASGASALRHKDLEALECKHVLSQYREKMLKPELALSRSASRSLNRLLITTFAEVFPENPNYKSPGCDLFIDALEKGESIVNRGGWWFNNQASKTVEEVKIMQDRYATNQQFKALLSNVAPVPTEEQYRTILKVMDVEADAQPSELIIKFKLGDDKMYARFLVEWELAMREALKSAKPIMELCTKYLTAHLSVMNKTGSAGASDSTGAGLLAQIESSLNEINPKANLDYPKPYSPEWPKNLYKNLCLKNIYGLPEIKDETGQLLGDAKICEVAVKNNNENKTLSTINSYSPIKGIEKTSIPFTDTSIILAPTEGEWRIPVKAEKYSYKVRLSLADLPLPPDDPLYKIFKGIDSCEVTSQTAANKGEVLMGQIFDITLPCPAKAVGKQPLLRWITKDMNRCIFLTDLPTIRDSGAPTNGTYFDDSGRYDIAVLKENISDTNINATLQFIGVNSDTNHVGPQHLVAIAYVDDLKTMTFDQANEKDSDGRTQMMQKLTPTNNEAWLKAMNDFDERVNQLNLTETEKVQQKLNEHVQVCKELGVDVGYLDVPSYISTTEISILPALLEIQKPAGWENSNHQTCSRNSFIEYHDTSHQAAYTKKAEVKLSDGMVTRSANSLLFVCFGTRPEHETDFKAEFAKSPGATSRTVQYGEFKGTAFEYVAESNGGYGKPQAEFKTPYYEVLYSIRVIGRALLKKGGLYLCLNYECNVAGNRAVKYTDHKYDDNGKFISSTRNVLCDEIKNAKNEYGSLKSVIETCFSTIKLVPNKNFKLPPKPKTLSTIQVSRDNP